MRRLLPLLSLLLAACEGRVSELPGTSTAELSPCTATPTVGTAPMRRLSHLEYGYSLADLLAADPAVPPVVAAQQATLTADPVSLGFKNSAAFLQVSTLLAQQYMDAAEAVSTQAVANLGALLPCAPTGDEAGCARQFIAAFGPRLYRRALEADEVGAYQQVYASARSAGYDFATGIQWVLFSFLQAPGFLYRVELDAPGDPPVRPVRPEELAVRLSYLLWQSVPDPALSQAAATGKLATRADVEAQARRMLADPRARRRDFYDQWLNLDALASFSRDSAVYPDLDPGLPGLLQQEVHHFVDGVLAADGGTLAELYTSPTTWVNAPLARHYGFAGVSDGGWQPVRWPGRRGGLFMLGGVLAQKDKSNRTSIVRRGLMLRTQLLCQVVPAPPPGVPPLGPVDGTLSQADRLAAHRSNPACSGCHTLMDPLGTAFENIDAVGRDRTHDEAGHPVATLGSLDGLSQAPLDGPLADGLELMSRAVRSADVSACFSLQLYRFGVGRAEEPADVCSRYQLRQRFLRTGGNLEDALVALTQTDDFLFRAVTPP